jgi:hypothetical protein
MALSVPLKGNKVRRELIDIISTISIKSRTEQSTKDRESYRECMPLAGQHDLRKEGY